MTIEEMENAWLSLKAEKIEMESEIDRINAILSRARRKAKKRQFMSQERLDDLSSRLAAAKQRKCEIERELSRVNSERRLVVFGDAAKQYGYFEHGS